jgi:integrase
MLPHCGSHKRVPRAPMAHLWRSQVPRKILEDKFVRSATSQGALQHDYFDGLCIGLSLRVTSAGKKTWAFTYTSPRDGKRARITLGTYPATSIAVARTHGTTQRGIVEAATDPRDVANEQDAGMTIAELIENRMKYAVKGKLRSADNIESRYKNHVIPYVGSKLVKDFRMRDLNGITDRILDAGHPVMANHVFNDVRALLRWAVKRDEIAYSPLAEAERPTKEDSIKDRFLSLAEINWLWNALPTIFIGSERKDGIRTDSDRVISILRTILASGQRPGEVCAIKRNEMDRTNKLWTIPPSKTKNKRVHVVPLNAIAFALISAAMDRTNGKYIFPNDEGEGPFDARVLAKTVKRAFEPTKSNPKPRMGDLPKFTPHDLRRTLATQMSLEENGLDIPDIFISHVLNHTTETRKTVTQRVYNQNKYLAEKRTALKAWGTFLQHVIDGTVGSLGDKDALAKVPRRLEMSALAA